MAGKHRAKTERRQPGAYVWVGTGAVTLALGAALAGGAGIASADTTGSTTSGSRVSPPGKSGPSTSIRTTISAQSVNTSTHSSRPAPKPAEGEDKTTSVVSHRDSVVRDQNPAVTGDNNPGPGPTVAETVIGLNNGDLGVLSGIPGLEATKNIPFIELGGGGGGLLSKIAGALSGGLF
jgi:hypothetical protein